MSVLTNVRAFLGLSADHGDGHSYHYADDEEDTGAIYFEDDTGAVDVTEQNESFDYDGYEDDTGAADASDLIVFDEDLDLTDHGGEDTTAADSRERPERAKEVEAIRREFTEPRKAARSKNRRAKPDPSMALQEARPKIVTPRSFDDAQTVADGFKAEIPIVMNLTALDQNLARRLIDFASGFCYVTGGSMERIRARVFLLTPPTASLTSEDRRLLASRRYDRK